MRRTVMTVALAIVAFAVLISPATAQVSPDWTLIKYTNTGGNWLSISIRGHANGNGPVVLGFGLAQPQHGIGWVLPFRLGRGPTTVSLVANGTHEQVTLLPEPSGSFDAVIDLAPGDGAVAVVVFVANGVLAEVIDDAPSGAVRLKGAGARALELDDVSTGAGAVAGPAGVAAGTVKAQTATGIVGGIEMTSCAVCIGTWRSPAGVAGTWAVAHTHLGPLWLPDPAGVGHINFAGPAGSWTWRWMGLGLIHARYGAFQVLEDGGPAFAQGAPVVAAWAPVGEDWKLWELANHWPIIPVAASP